MNVAHSLSAFVSGACLFWAVTAGAQGNVFTYQGRLGSDSAPANGSYDFTFSIHDAASDGSQIGVATTNLAIAVNNGLFMTTLDFEPSAFGGAPRWLEIRVRTNGAPAFTLLNPRQRLTATPYALYAPTAGVAATAISANTVAADSVGLPGLQAGSVDSSKIADASITAADLTSTLRNDTFWKLGGNAGTTAGAHFLGTTDKQPLELKVNGQRAFRLEPTTNSPNVIAGFFGNFVSSNAVGATIGGGGEEGQSNFIQAHTAPTFPPTNVVPHFSTIGGGKGNQITANQFNTIAGGANNVVEGWSPFYKSSDKNSIGGGEDNRIANSTFSTIAGGASNRMHGGSFGVAYSTIGGGRGNSIAGANDPTSSATIAGGAENSVGYSSGSTTIGGGSGNVIGPEAGDSTIAGGSANGVAFARNAMVGGGANNFVGASHGTVAGGQGNRVVFGAGTISGGRSNSVNASYGTVPGGLQAFARSHAQLAYAGGQFQDRGDAQTSVYVYRGVTTNATPSHLSLDGLSQRINIPDNSSWTFNTLVIGRTATGVSAGFEIRGVIERNAGITSFVGTPIVTPLAADSGDWSVNVAADDANDSLVVAVTGANETTIRWVASVRTVEVSF